MKRKLKTHSRLILDTLADYQNTYYAFEELINNAVQAGAKNIKIKIEETPEDAVSDLPITFFSIEDDGSGVPESEFEERILTIATEYKTNSGGKGIGRFAAFQMGENIDIETISYDPTIKKFTLIKCGLSRSDIMKNMIEDQEIVTTEKELDGNFNSYYKISISGFYDYVFTNNNRKNKIHENLLIKNISRTLFERYAYKIFNSELNFVINEKPIDKEDFTVGDKETKIVKYIDTFGKEYKLLFSFYKVKKSNKEIKVFLTSDNSGIQNVVQDFNYSAEWIPPANYSYLVYIHSDYFTPNLTRNFVFDDMDPNTKKITRAIKDSLNEHFSSKYREFSAFSKNLKNDKYYPYREKNSSSKTKEIVFTKFAYFIEEKYNLLNNQDELRSIIYTLVDKSISNGDLEDVLKSIISLNKESIQKFKELLNISPIESVIEFSEHVASKNKFIDILYELTYGDVSKKIKERSELHKIIEKHLWIFGERYADTPLLKLYSDKNLENNLNKLRQSNFEYEVTKKDENLDIEVKGKVKNITDLFFYNEKILDNNRREIMIVELKSPKCLIGPKEVMQAEKYATQIINDTLFSRTDHFKILLISSKLSGVTEIQLRDMKKPNADNPFCIKDYQNGRVEIWVMTWMDVITMNRKKLSYLGKVLQTEDTDTSAEIGITLEDIKNEKIRSKLNRGNKEIAV